MATTYLTRTFGSAGSLTTWTLSFWIKKTSNGIEQRIFSCDDDASGNNDQWMKFDGSDIIQFSQYQSGYTQKIETNRKFRDTSGWYHIVLVWDTTNGTAGDRTRLYVNGVRETSFSSEVQASSSLGSLINNTTYPLEIGRRGLTPSQFFPGLLSYVYFIDGLAYEPTVFGSTDATSGEWVINTSPSVTYGTNGFLIMKDGNTITDQGSNSNDFTLGAGTLTDLQDCPDDVFATFNGAFNLSDIALSEGNTKTFNSNSNWKYVPTTLGASKGKYYCEYKITINGGYIMLGVADMQYAVSQDQNSYTHIGAGTGGVGVYDDSGEKYIEGTNTTFCAGYATNDIVSIALDMDNNKVYFAKNGDWCDGVGAWGSSTFNSATGAITLPTTGGTYAFGSSVRSSASIQANFGNGYFGTTAISSEGTNASNIGKFEYDVPTGFTALSLKGLQE